MVAATEQVEVVEDVVEIVEDLAYPVARIQRPGLAVGRLEVGAEAAEQLGHGQVRLAIAMVDGGIEDHRLARRQHPLIA